MEHKRREFVVNFHYSCPLIDVSYITPVTASMSWLTNLVDPSNNIAKSNKWKNRRK